MTKNKIVENLEKCPHYISCSQNLCPLDFDLEFRSGNNADKCRWMREPKKKKIKGREFISGGRAMPDAILDFVPEDNLRWLNESSRKAWVIRHAIFVRCLKNIEKFKK